MKTLGIIGGIGPESTMEYYRTIIALYRQQTGDGSYPQFIINSIDLKTEIELVAANDAPALIDYMVVEIEKIARAGADFGIIASNTPHIVFDGIAAKSSIPLISIVKTARTAAEERGWKRPALFGTSFTMSGKFYPEVFARAGIKLVPPGPADAAYIHDKYMNELVNGNFLSEIRTRILEIVGRMKEENGIDSVILAGTELPLLLRDPVYHGIPFLDTMRVHAEATVQRMLQ